MTPWRFRNVHILKQIITTSVSAYKMITIQCKYISIYLPIYLSIYISLHTFYLFIYPYTCSIYQSILTPVLSIDQFLLTKWLLSSASISQFIYLCRDTIKKELARNRPLVDRLMSDLVQQSADNLVDGVSKVLHRLVDIVEYIYTIYIDW